jgi:hypothetical protein
MRSDIVTAGEAEKIGLRIGYIPSENSFSGQDGCRPLSATGKGSLHYLRPVYRRESTLFWQYSTTRILATAVTPPASSTAGGNYIGFDTSDALGTSGTLPSGVLNLRELNSRVSPLHREK